MLPKDLARGYVRKLIFSIERKKHPKERTGELCSHEVSDRPCSVRREGGKSLVIGGPSLVILEGKACNPL